MFKTIRSQFARLLVGIGITSLSIVQLAAPAHVVENLEELAKQGVLEWRVNPDVPNENSLKSVPPSWNPDSGTPLFAACGPATDILKTVASWQYVALGSPQDFMHANEVTLRCGDDLHGLKHIRLRHPEWSTLAAIEGKDGDALIRIATDAALENTTWSRRDQPSSPGRDGSFCASAQIYLVDKNRETIVKTLEPSIFVAEHGHHVITAFPTNTSKCK